MVLLNLADSLALLPTPLTCLVVGATSGIGAGIAHQLATHPDLSSIIYIAGRRAAQGEQVMADSLAFGRARSGKATIKFKAVDASLMKNVRAFCEELAEELKGRKLELLVLSQGIIQFSRSNTAEGIESVIATNYYGRMCFIRELIRLELLSPTCLVISVLNGRAGDPTGKTIDLSDMSMRRTGIVASIKQNMAMSDVMITALGKEGEAGNDGGRRVFVHDYPGFVKTDLVKNPILSTIFNITGFFLRRSVSIDTAGDYILRGGIACWAKTNAHLVGTGTAKDKNQGVQAYWFVDEKGEVIEKEKTPMDVMVKVRDHTWELIDEALKGVVTSEG